MGSPLWCKRLLEAGSCSFTRPPSGTTTAVSCQKSSQSCYNFYCFSPWVLQSVGEMQNISVISTYLMIKYDGEFLVKAYSEQSYQSALPYICEKTEVFWFYFQFIKAIHTLSHNLYKILRSALKLWWLNLQTGLPDDFVVGHQIKPKTAEWLVKACAC